MTKPRKTAAAKQSRKAAVKSAASKPKPRKRSTPKTAVAKRPDLAAKVQLVSVFGPFNSRVLIEMAATTAQELFADLGQPISHSRVIEAVERDLADVRDRDAELADSQLGATAVSLAYELEHPYNSATSKSMCARALNETMEKLRALAPPKEHGDELDELTRRRDERRARVAS